MTKLSNYKIGQNSFHCSSPNCIFAYNIGDHNHKPIRKECGSRGQICKTCLLKCFGECGSTSWVSVPISGKVKNLDAQNEEVMRQLSQRAEKKKLLESHLWRNIQRVRLDLIAGPQSVLRRPAHGQGRTKALLGPTAITRSSAQTCPPVKREFVRIV